MRVKIFTLLVAFVFCGLTSASAAIWVGSVDDGFGSAATGVQEFDWVSGASGLFQGISSSGASGAITAAVGTQFNYLYQASLTGLLDANGQPVVFPGLADQFEYTLVAKIPMVIAAKVPTATGEQVFFRTLGGGLFYIYYDAPADADVGLGVGFEGDDLVAFGVFDTDQSSFYDYNASQDSANGIFIFNGTVSTANPAYLDPSSITGIELKSTLNYPPIASETVNFFDGVVFSPESVTDNDVNLKSDGSSTFTYEEEVAGSCRVTAGGVKDGITMPCELKKNGMPDAKTCVDGATDTWGGQAGAQPGVDGNWTHHHIASPQQKFVFHSNDLFYISCSDPGACVPAAANADNHQIDFSGIGHFNNQKGYSPALPSGDVCFMVHLEDIGEPGPGGKWPSSSEPCTHCPGTPIEEGDCVNCTDYYEIKIFDSAAKTDDGQCLGTLVYYNGSGPSFNCGAGDPSLMGYFTRSGNVQMHPENN